MSRKNPNPATKPHVRRATLSTLHVFGSAEAISIAARSKKQAEKHSPGAADWDKIEAKIFGPKK